jgi:hypothetical protein
VQALKVDLHELAPAGERWNGGSHERSAQGSAAIPPEQERSELRIAFAGAFALCLSTSTLCQAEAVTSSLEKLTRNGDRIRIEYSVTNAGAAVNTVVVKCTMFDKDQRPLGTATSTISDLGAGERDTGTAATTHAAGMQEVRCRVQSVY